MAEPQPTIPAAYDSILTQQVIGVLAEYFEEDEKLFSIGTKLVQTPRPISAVVNQRLEMDSLDLVELTMGLGERFGISIPDADAEKFTSVQRVVEYLQTAYPHLVEGYRPQQ